ncbi:MAG TPA: recombination protein RecR [Deltaproteobacteria bacterium]|nr:recombination protein RecR [Deltaproteobacteria bacterium]
MSSSPAMDRLVASLKRLPGIGEKSATRLAYFLLSAPEELARELSESIARLQRDTVVCETCFTLSDRSPCPVCAHPGRDTTLICVVEEPADMAAVERSGGFKGLYHVLGGALSPIDGMGPETLRIRELERRARDGGVKEIILATNPTAEGDATAHFLAERLRGASARITRIAYGMPLGGDLEYADHVTVSRAIENRRSLSDGGV